jgi:benzoate-CoA ligase
MIFSYASEAPTVEIPSTFNIASHLIDRNLAAGRANRTAVYEDGRTLTYAELAEMVNRCGNALRSLGVEAEQRVLMAVPDSAEFIALFLGAAKIGAVPVPVNTAAFAEDYLYYLRDSGARVFVLHEDLCSHVEGILGEVPSLEHVLVMPSEPARKQTITTQFPSGHLFHWHLLGELLQAAAPKLDAEPTSKDDVAFMLYTSGSTGGPKGAVHLHHDIPVATELYAIPILRMTEKDICFSVSKLFFAYGLGNGMFFPLSVGAVTVLNPHRPKAEIVFEFVERFRPTLFFSVPTLYASLLHVEEQKDLSSIRFGISAGEALPAEIFQRFHERFGVSVLDGIGSTEMTHIFISNRPGDIRPGTSGRLVPGYEAKIVDDSGVELPAGELGNLWVKGDGAAAFYWRKQEQTKRTMVGEWLITGDKYYVDPEGYFCYCGRADDMLRCAGQWVSPAEVENALLAFPGVVEAAIVGCEDHDGLMKPKAFLVMKSHPDGPWQDLLRDSLHRKLAGFKVPRWFEIVQELPKTPTGKIQRFKLRGRTDPRA